jgi:hypothetical protein
MTREEQESLLKRSQEVFRLAGGDNGNGMVMAVSLLLLGDRLVGALDSIRSSLRLIEDQLGSGLDETSP